MAPINPFDLLGDDDNDVPSFLGDYSSHDEKIASGPAKKSPVTGKDAAQAVTFTTKGKIKFHGTLEFECEASDPAGVEGAGEQIVGLQKDLELMSAKCAAAEMRALNAAVESLRVENILKKELERMSVEYATAAMRALDAESENIKLKVQVTELKTSGDLQASYNKGLLTDQNALNVANIKILKSLLEKYEDMGADCKADIEQQIKEKEYLLRSSRHI